MTIIHPHSTLHVVKTASLSGVFIRFRNSVYDAVGIVKKYTSCVIRRMWNGAQFQTVRRSLLPTQSSTLEYGDSKYPENGGSKLLPNVANCR